MPAHTEEGHLANPVWGARLLQVNPCHLAMPATFLNKITNPVILAVNKVFLVRAYRANKTTAMEMDGFFIDASIPPVYLPHRIY